MWGPRRSERRVLFLKIIMAAACFLWPALLKSCPAVGASQPPFTFLLSSSFLAFSPAPLLFASFPPSSFWPSLHAKPPCFDTLHLACQQRWHMYPFNLPCLHCWKSIPSQAGTSRALCFPLKIFCPIKPPDIRLAEYLVFWKGFLLEGPSYKAMREYNLRGVFTSRSPPVRGEDSFISAGVLSTSGSEQAGAQSWVTE